jgi:hypothetical protein
MFARITRARARSLPIDSKALAAINGLMGTFSVMAGHRGAAWLLNRKTGDAVAIDFYDGLEDLDNTSQGDLRDAIAEALALEVTAVAEYEVVGVDRLLR